ncbi:MAG: hypothetical protein FWF97_02685 [Alphaproteobacteria bacterium]|nr:hypothetical protein [Alphaproteobacteria bacterium]
MRRFILYSLCFILCGGGAFAASTGQNARDFMSPVAFNTMEPFMNQQMANGLRPDAANRAFNPSSAFSRNAVGSGNTPISGLVREKSVNTVLPAEPVSDGQAAQGVVLRKTPKGTPDAPYSYTQFTPGNLVAPQLTARSGLPPVAQNGQRVVVPRSSGGANAARSATTAGSGAAAVAAGQRRVVPRATREDSASQASNRGQAAPAMTTVPMNSVSASQCLADYKACMNGYCQRKNTLYNRCSCSPQLARIDAEFKPAIEEILRQIVIFKNGGKPGELMSNDELNEFWEDTFAEFTGGNDMMSLTDALNIDWADSENRMQGEKSFVMGHEYCVQHLRGCFYMASNLRDAYRSEIARDCATYEKHLGNIKLAGESVLAQIGE